MRVVFALTALCLFTQTTTAADWQLQLSGYAVAPGQAADPQQREQKAPDFITGALGRVDVW